MIITSPLRQFAMGRPIKSAATRSEIHATTLCLLIPPALALSLVLWATSQSRVLARIFILMLSNSHNFKGIGNQQGTVSHQGFQQTTGSNATAVDAFQSSSIDSEGNIHDLRGSSIICLRKARLVSVNRGIANTDARKPLSSSVSTWILRAGRKLPKLGNKHKENFSATAVTRPWPSSSRKTEVDETVST
jgi:hypothetical protein